jgi:hypothetical protein
MAVRSEAKPSFLVGLMSRLKPRPKKTNHGVAIREIDDLKLEM